MKLVFFIIAIIFAIQIFKQPGIKKLPWFFAGILFFPNSIVLVDPFNFSRFLTYTLLITYFIENKRWFLIFIEFPAWKALLFLFLTLLLIGIIDDRHNIFVKLFFPINLFITNFLGIFLTFHYLKSKKDIIKIYKTLLLLFIPFCILGIIDFVLKESIYNKFLTNIYGNYNFVNYDENSQRFRISSFAYNSIYYGLLLAIITLIQIFIFAKINLKFHQKIFYILLIVLLLLNLFLANSRTPIMSFVIGVSIFVIWGLNLKKKITVTIIVSLLCIVIFNFAPKTNEIFLESLKVFSSKSTELRGSSREMREAQLAKSILIFNRSPIFGNGFNYIAEDLGYSSDPEKSKSANSLYGFESYSFNLLIEQGLIGILGNLLFFASIINILIKGYKKSFHKGQILAILNISILMMFLFFITGTGALSSFPFVMALLGVGLKGIQLNTKTYWYRRIDPHVI